MISSILIPFESSAMTKLLLVGYSDRRIQFAYAGKVRVMVPCNLECRSSVHPMITVISVRVARVDSGRYGILAGADIHPHFKKTGAGRSLPKIYRKLMMVGIRPEDVLTEFVPQQNTGRDILDILGCFYFQRNEGVFSRADDIRF
jgi:hypothetical protein